MADHEGNVTQVTRRMKIFKNPFRKKKESDKLSTDHLKQMASLFDSFDRFNQQGLIERETRDTEVSVYVSFYLANRFMYGEGGVWDGFVSNLERWATFRHFLDDYNQRRARYMADFEAARRKDLGDAYSPAAARIEAADLFHQDVSLEHADAPRCTIYVMGASKGAGPVVVARSIVDADTGQVRIETLPFNPQQ